MNRIRARELVMSYELWVSSNFHGKGRKRPGFDNLSKKLLKNGGFGGRIYSGHFMFI